jgi:PRC-barrel domain
MEPRGCNRWQSTANRRDSEAAKTRETHATGCRRLPEKAGWHGKTLVDRDGQKIGKLQDVYVDVETDEPMFGTVKEGLIGRHLTFVPLAGITFGPDALQMAVTREQVKSAPISERSTAPPEGRRGGPRLRRLKRRLTLGGPGVGMGAPFAVCSRGGIAVAGRAAMPVETQRRGVVA